eukprot:83122_1
MTKVGIGMGMGVIISYCSYKYLVNKPKVHSKMLPIKTFVENTIWTRDYIVEYMGTVFYARCTVIRLSNNKYLIHSPSPMDDTFSKFLQNKEIEYIVAPGNYHYFNVALWNKIYPKAKILIAPGVEYKAHNLKSSSIYGILHDNYIDYDKHSVLNKDFALTLIRGFSEMNEIVLLHKTTSTLIILDAIEYVTPQYYDYANRMFHLCWILFRMHNKALPAPEYQYSLKYKNLAKQSFEKILSWNFNQIIISHGQNIQPQKESNMDNQQAVTHCKNLCRKCWSLYL